MDKNFLKITLVALFLSVGALAYAQIVREAKLGWSPVTKDTDGTVISGGVTYSVYQGAKGASKLKVKSGLTATTVTIKGLPIGETCFDVTVTGNGQESDHSDEACKSFVVGKPVKAVIQFIQ